MDELVPKEVSKESSDIEMDPDRYIYDRESSSRDGLRDSSQSVEMQESVEIFTDLLESIPQDSIQDPYKSQNPFESHEDPYEMTVDPSRQGTDPFKSQEDVISLVPSSHGDPSTHVPFDAHADLLQPVHQSIPMDLSLLNSSHKPMDIFSLLESAHKENTLDSHKPRNSISPSRKKLGPLNTNTPSPIAKRKHSPSQYMSPSPTLLRKAILDESSAVPAIVSFKRNSMTWFRKKRLLTKKKNVV